MKTERHISAGGVVFRLDKGEVYVALISVKDGKVWCLPKGLVEKGENIARTAHREVREETGLDGKIIKLIGNIHYFYVSKEEEETKRIFKIVYFFLMECTGGDVTEHDSEVVDCRWFPLDEAIELAEYKDEKGILQKAGEILRGL
ncbi:MAG: NUDIX hydrolase [Nitrospirae bacterium]|nr:NUDIX hydrolase [Nitrospirota bacterium]